MAWTAPRTYVTGEMLTAAILNTDHRDNIKEFWHVRARYGVGTASANLVELLNTGAQSYSLPIIFELSNAYVNVGWGHNGYIMVYDGAAVQWQIMGGSNGNSQGSMALAGTGKLYVVPSVGTHTWRLIFSSDGNCDGGGGLLTIWERNG